MEGLGLVFDLEGVWGVRGSEVSLRRPLGGVYGVAVIGGFLGV